MNTNQKVKIKTTRMSTKGQVVIPQEIRESLGLETSDELVVAYNKDTIILRKLTLEDVIKEADIDLERGQVFSHEEMKQRHGV